MIFKGILIMQLMIYEPHSEIVASSCFYWFIPFHSEVIKDNRVSLMTSKTMEAGA